MLSVNFQDRAAWKCATNAAILIGAMLVAIHIRLRVAVGAQLYSNYVAQFFSMYVVLVAAAVVPFMVMKPAKRRFQLSETRWQFIELLLGDLLAFLIFSFLTPDLSLLQLALFVFFVVVLGHITILVPERLLRNKTRSTLQDSLETLWRNRALLTLWVQNNIRARYMQAILGIIWIILLPLAQAVILAFVFSQFMRVDVGNVPYISFFFAALVPWTFFSQALMTSTGSIVGLMGLINQIYFPREIIVLVKLGETIVDVSFMFLALLGVNLLVGIAPNIYYLYLPLIYLIILCFTLGLALFCSYLTVMIRDIPQLLAVILQLLFYLTPIIYPVSLIPPNFRIITLINPLVPLVEACRDIIVFQRPPDTVTLYYPIVISLTLLYLGYSFFKSNERRLSDYV